MNIKELKDNEMQLIGGGNIASPVINALANVVEFIYNLGVQLGSGIRRLINSSYCPMD